MPFSLCRRLIVKRLDQICKLGKLKRVESCRVKSSADRVEWSGVEWLQQVAILSMSLLSQRSSFLSRIASSCVVLCCLVSSIPFFSSCSILNRVVFLFIRSFILIFLQGVAFATTASQQLLFCISLYSVMTRVESIDSRLIMISSFGRIHFFNRIDLLPHLFVRFLARCFVILSSYGGKHA